MLAVREPVARGEERHDMADGEKAIVVDELQDEDVAISDDEPAR